MQVGKFTGNGTSYSVTGLSFAPNWVFIKNAETAVSPVYNVNESYGDYSSYFTNTANLTTAITSLNADGFSVGASNTANGSTNDMYWVAFGGAVANSSGSGTFEMATGTYVGNAAYQRVTNLGFSPTWLSSGEKLQRLPVFLEPVLWEEIIPPIWIRQWLILPGGLPP